jgi:predicted nucleic acid-binding protein
MIVCDTGPLVAAALSNDNDHHACVELLTDLHLANRAVPVPAPVVAEVGYLLGREAGAHASRCSCTAWPMVTLSP